MRWVRDPSGDQEAGRKEAEGGRQKDDWDMSGRGGHEGPVGVAEGER